MSVGKGGCRGGGGKGGGCECGEGEGRVSGGGGDERLRVVVSVEKGVRVDECGHVCGTEVREGGWIR